MVAAPSSRTTTTRTASTSSNKNGSNPQHHVKFLLSRGYTSRLLPPGSVLRHLSAEETDKDLRHFQAYHRAVISYRQQYYVAVNPGAVTAANSNGSPYSLTQHPGLLSSQATSSVMVGGGVLPLPVRLDPEEEKRLALLRRKIARAECLREDLEQQYVALRAHYVQYSREVRQLADQVATRQEFLQGAVQERATTLGLMRARLQMTRDVLAALQRRTHVLEQFQQQQLESGSSNVVPTSTNPAPSADKDQPLLESLWNQVEEELKKQHRKLAASSKAKPMVWPCVKMPPTPYSVPILLSNTSTAPEKSLAFAASGVFGSRPKSSLVWIMPELQTEADAADEDPNHQDLESLREESRFLQDELDKERRHNQELSQQIARGRTKNDEWVAMICLVRQETESVLHRHNVVLESDLAQEAAERLQMEQQQAAQQALASAVTSTAAVSQATNGEAIEKDPHLTQELDVPHVAANGPDDDNDGDDEGSEGEDAVDEDDDDNHEEAATSSSSNKRSANPENLQIPVEEEDARRKRRKL